MSLDRLLSSSLTIWTNVPSISQLQSASIAKTNNSCYISLVQYGQMFLVYPSSDLLQLHLKQTPTYLY